MSQLSIKKILAKLLDNKSMIDRFYPVGSYYETSNTSFNPNTAWGGTWEKEAQGKVHVSAGTTYTAGSSYGSDTHTHTTGDVTLTVNQIPSHTHYIAQRSGSGQNFSGWHWELSSGHVDAVYNTNVAANRATSAIGYTGGGQKHNHGSTGSTTRNSWQPSIAVVRWHRTA